jgi:hypothetical protein
VNLMPRTICEICADCLCEHERCIDCQGCDTCEFDAYMDTVEVESDEEEY